MNISSISSQSVNTPATKSKADETLQQLADDGDPVAIAELAAENPQPNSGAAATAATAQVGASEPGKGQQVDQYV